MISMLAVGALLLVATGTARAQGAPDDRYAKVLKGKVLEEGKGFPGLVTLGQPTPAMYKLLGPGREDMNFPFWYFYDQGPWRLVVVAELANGEFRTRAIEVSGDKAPATAKGARVGDGADKITKLYGPPSPFSASVGSPLLTNMVSVDIKSGAETALPDPEQAYKDSLYYPDLSTLFVMTGGHVARIVVVLRDDPLPTFLQAPESVAAVSKDVAVIDPKVDAPGWGSDTSSTVLHVPPPPKLIAAKVGRIALTVPKGWTKAGSRWTDKSNKEWVELSETKAAAGERPEEFFAAQEQGFGANRLIAAQRVLPADFAKLIGADQAYALWKQEGGKGKGGQPLRTFVLMAAKGDRRFVLVVTRTASGAMPSPDGEALARGVMRSLRIK
jgi:hypothetical protein